MTFPFQALVKFNDDMLDPNGKPSPLRGLTGCVLYSGTRNKTGHDTEVEFSFASTPETLAEAHRKAYPGNTYTARDMIDLYTDGLRVWADSSDLTLLPG
jgi:hypothetical protein